MSGTARGQRMFVALVPPDNVREHLDDFLAPRRDAAPDGLRWSDPDQLHLTLAFVPAVPDHALDDLVEGVGTVAARGAAFVAAIGGGGAFPDVASARVLWTGLTVEDAGRAELERLAAGVRGAANHAGVRVDGQRFRPHLTLGRLNRPGPVARLVAVLDTYAGPSWTVDHVALVGSHLGEGPRGRPRHEVLAELPLG